MQNIDQLIHGRWIITCDKHNSVLENHAIAISGSKIIAILPSQEAKTKYSAKKEEYFSDHALLPGFINSHTHIPMNVLRGFADDRALMDWLTNYIWPAEKKWLSHEFVLDASLLAMAEMIRGGTTCFNDSYFFIQATAEAAEQSGIRAHIGMFVIDFPTPWANDMDEYLAKGFEFYDRYKNHERIKATMAPHSAYTVKEKDFEKIKKLSDEHNLRIHIHCQEAVSDIEGAIKFNNKRPLRCLDDVGLVSPNLITVHMTQLDDQDFDLLAAKKPHVVHCPESNMKLASGICPVEKLMSLGINVALGTDGAASNNDLDMIGEMRSAAFLAKISSMNPLALPAPKVLEMATINGAKALGIDQVTGSLEIGKEADFIAIDLNRLETLPVYHPISQIVYSASRDQVTDVWVAGKRLMEKRQLTTLDEAELKKKAQSWGKKIQN